MKDVVENKTRQEEEKTEKKKTNKKNNRQKILTLHQMSLKGPDWIVKENMIKVVNRI